MKEVYLLLRNNQQTGPFTIEELLKQQLRPTDLVWVEGRTQAWSYPFEIEELKVVLGASDIKKFPIPAKPTTSSRDEEIEERAEELRLRVQSFTPRYFSQRILADDDLSSDVLRKLAAGRIEFVDHRRKEVPAYEWISAIMVTLIVIAGVYGGQKYFGAGNTVEPSVVTHTITTDSHAAKSKALPMARHTLAEKEENNQEVTDSANKKLDSTVLLVADNKKANDAKKTKGRVVKDSAPKIKQIAPPVTIENMMPPQVTILAEEPMQLTDSQTKTVTEEPTEKKKGGLFRGLFKKKKKQAAEQDTLPVQGQGN